MNVTVLIPDDLARRLSADGGDLARRALEAFALEAFAVEEFRAGRLTPSELRALLGFGTRAALDAFLKAREVFVAYDLSDLDDDRRDLDRLGL